VPTSPYWGERGATGSPDSTGASVAVPFDVTLFVRLPAPLFFRAARITDAGSLGDPRRLWRLME
jgi:hypothetical protein